MFISPYWWPVYGIKGQGHSRPSRWRKHPRRASNSIFWFLLHEPSYISSGWVSQKAHLQDVWAGISTFRMHVWWPSQPSTVSEYWNTSVYRRRPLLSAQRNLIVPRERFLSRKSALHVYFSALLFVAYHGVTYSYTLRNMSVRYRWQTAWSFYMQLTRVVCVCGRIRTEQSEMWPVTTI